MKKCAPILSVIILLSLIYPLNSYGQTDTNVATNQVVLTVDGSALLGIRTPGVSLSLAGATEAGAPVQTAASDQTTRLRISSIVESGITRTIEVSINAEPVGTELLVSALTPNASFMGNSGSLATGVLLSTSEQELVTGIGTCWSGTSEDDGYVIKYDFRMKESAVNLVSSTVTVTYTLSEEL